MNFREALRALKNDPGRAFFYWLTFVLTTMFVFLFLNIAMSKQIGVTFLNTSNTDIPTNLALILIIICIIEILFANDFYVRSKSKDLAVRLISGATYLQLASYLLSQTFILLAIAIPAGITASLFLIPVINVVSHAISASAFTVTITANAVFVTAGILVGVIFWATFLNLGFAYRHTAAQLLNVQQMKTNSEPLFPSQNVNPTFRKVFFALLTIIPVILFYANPGAVMASALIGIAGISGCLTRILIPFMTDYIDQKKTDDPFIVSALGFLRTDIKLLKWNILLLLITSIFLVSILLTASVIREILLILLSYIVMNVLLSLAVMFRFASELQGRYRNFRTLEHLGFTSKELEKIVSIEVYGLYGIILAVVLLYICNIFAALIINAMLSLRNAVLLTLFFVLPLLMCCLITRLYYRRAVLVRETAGYEEEESSASASV